MVTTQLMTPKQLCTAAIWPSSYSTLPVADRAFTLNAVHHLAGLLANQSVAASLTHANERLRRPVVIDAVGHIERALYSHRAAQSVDSVGAALKSSKLLSHQALVRLLNECTST